MIESNLIAHNPIKPFEDRRNNNYSRFRKTIDELLTYSDKLDEFLELTARLEEHYKFHKK